MNKVKALHPNRVKIQSPSPDSKRSNQVKPTQPPTQEIQKFLNIHKHQVKLKKQTSTSKLLNLSHRSELSNIDNQTINRNRIKQLEEQIQQYKHYMLEYEQLAVRNKKLQQQMGFILEELENRNGQQTPIKKNSYHLKTVENSREERTENMNYWNQDSVGYQEQDRVYMVSEINNLHKHIENLEGIIKGLMDKNRQFEQQIKTNIKKDLTQMELKLINYIFSLQQNITRVFPKNNDISNKIQTSSNSSEPDPNSHSNHNKNIIQDQCRDRDRDRNRDLDGKRSKLKGSNNEDYQQDENSMVMLSITQTKKQSVVSLMNLQVTNPFELQKEFNGKQAQNLEFQCAKCDEYLSIVDELMLKNKQLQNELNKVKHQRSENENMSQKYERMSLNQKHDRVVSVSDHKIDSKDRNKFKTKILKQDQNEIRSYQNKNQFIYEIDNQQNLTKSDKIFERINSMQSNINIIIDESLASSFADVLKNSNHQVSEQIIHTRQSNAQCYMKLSKVKQQLIKIMESMQYLVSECEMSSKGGLVGELNNKIRHQGEYISDLQEEISRLRLEVEKISNDKDKIEKLMKFQVREEEEKGMPYFRMISDPISCVDHKSTKGKINDIINSIQNFQHKYHQLNDFQ